MFVVLPPEDHLSGNGNLSFDLGARCAYSGVDRTPAGHDSRGFGHYGILRVSQPT